MMRQSSGKVGAQRQRRRRIERAASAVDDETTAGKSREPDAGSRPALAEQGKLAG